jgi:capsid protein
MDKLGSYLGVHCGLSLQLLLMDWSGLSYSAAKASLLQSNKSFRIAQRQFEERWLRPIYQWRLSKWVKDGTLKIPAGLEKSYWNHIWIPPAVQMLDPQKDVMANMAMIDAGFTSWSDISLSYGHTFDDMVARRQRDEQKWKDAGITLSKSTLTRDAVSPAGPDANKASPSAPTPPTASELDDEEQEIDTQ